MNIRILLTAGLVGALSMIATSAYAMSAQDFVTKAGVANEFEIESSQLALEKSQNSGVKTFAQQMIDDHTKAGEDLTQALSSSQSNAQAPEGLDKKHQKLLDKLKSASADDFDKKYIDMQTDAHKDAVSLFSDYSKHGKDPALQSFATQTLPTLKMHLKHVKQLKS